MCAVSETQKDVYVKRQIQKRDYHEIGWQKHVLKSGCRGTSPRREESSVLVQGSLDCDKREHASRTSQCVMLHWSM